MPVFSAPLIAPACFSAWAVCAVACCIAACMRCWCAVHIYSHVQNAHHAIVKYNTRHMRGSRPTATLWGGQTQNTNTHMWMHKYANHAWHHDAHTHATLHTIHYTRVRYTR